MSHSYEPAESGTHNVPASSRPPPKEYNTPNSYSNLDASLPPVQHLVGGNEKNARHGSPATTASQREHRRQSGAISESADYDAPDAYVNLDEAMDVSPVQNPDEAPFHRYESLEHVRTRQQERLRDEGLRMQESQASESRERPPDVAAEEEVKEDTAERKIRVSRLATQIYTISYLVLFSILGTLARLGLQAVTAYPGMPVIFPSLWPNFAGSLVMGFLAEDRMLFRHEWGTSPQSGGSENSGDSSADPSATKKAHAATKTIPLYIGLATGFCGSFTSFSSFIRDMFLALSNDLPSSSPPRNGGYSLAALLAVLLTTLSLSLAGLFLGAHLAIALRPLTPSLPFPLTRKILDRLAVLLGWGAWLTAILLSVLPPDRFSPGPEGWRGPATFALVFAPLGCLARFYISLRLNGRLAAFPLGTFAVNAAGTAILGMAWDLEHVPLGGVVGCQVLQGIQDGFCGCLTTVSTWVAELAALTRRNAYVYGGVSVLAGLGLLVAIMGGLRWSSEGGFTDVLCIHSL
ncbi:CrcB-like protein-domain-containing protein [Lasiosphaeria hispida]|uniref:CrcB-like protein-domain-containing protein n=1 Tax=Lasiosphaeria hispida TaxID=260671 RepID=A0AAJ0HLK5_9PEZI|nr:CrcB-like protein-domain-containing protein [Lasiosphaeria hispida]